ncbi:MAG: hypothetical protein KF699_04960 [Phycisphaeraceae bacterium]|nr:hypothetical protein [Phycisphaeraceae bacterium]
MTDPAQSKSPVEATIAGPMLEAMGGIRRLGRTVLVGERAAVVLACALAAALAWGFADFFLRSPAPLRIAAWAVGLGTLAWWGARAVWPAARFAPSLTDLALRLERERPDLRGILASGVDLARQRAEGEQQTLAAPVIAEAARRAAALRPRDAVRRDLLARNGGYLLAALAAVVVVFVLSPDLASTGAQRVLWPFAAAEWPKRTGVADATGATVHPLGAALPLRAALLKSDGAPSRTRVAAEYRLIAEGRAGEWRRVLLTSQDRPVQAAPGVTGTLFERLIEPGTLGAADANATTELEYFFETSDDRTAVARVLLVEPPAVTGATLEAAEPDYARTADEGPRRIELGAGTDERAAPSPLLAGSSMRLTIHLNKDVPAAAAFAAGGSEWLRRTLGEPAMELVSRAEGVSLELAPRQWVLAWTLEEPVRINVRVEDEHGIADAEERGFRFDVLRDNPPTVVVVRPAEDKSLLQTAVVDLAGEARDDVALSWVALERRIARRPAGSEGGAPEPLGEPEVFARVDGAGAAGPRQLLAESILDLSTMPLRPGDEVWVTALAADTFALDGRRHEPVRSLVRKLRIISRDELVEQVWGELAGVRRNAMQIERDQRDLAQASARAGEQTARQNERAQAGITERLARQQEALRRIGERLAENDAAEPALENLLRESRGALERAGRQSVEAGQQLSDAADRASQENAGPEAGAQERARAQQAQQDVRDELASLIEMLDQGQDTWAARRAIEQALQAQRDLRDRTADTGQRTTGRSAEQLMPQERQELAEIAREQEELAERTRQAIEDMQSREETMRKSDPAAAQSMAQAARRGQREQVPERMEQAAQQAQRNQTNNAQQQQSQAIQALEQMLQDLDQTARNRDEVLRRALASLIESIDALIRAQTDELAALEAARDTGRFAGLDRSMARLHVNTLAVLEEANAGPRELAPVARLIDSAATEQAGATAALRRTPVDSGEAEERETASLKHLREARDLAEKLDREAAQREQQRKRAELKKKYTEALARQVALREGADALRAEEQNRRTRNAARLIGQDQQTLREDLAQLKSDTTELSEAKVFEFAHRRLDDLMRIAAEQLSQGESDEAVVRRQTSAARVLAQLIEALDQSRGDEDFREQEQSQQGQGGGQGGQQPLVPPAAELKLLRAMQQEAIEMTRSASDGPERIRTDAAAEAAALQQGIAEQARELLDRLAQQRGGDQPTGNEGGQP